MKIYFRRKQGGFKIALIVGKLRFALDYPSP